MNIKLNSRVCRKSSVFLAFWSAPKKATLPRKPTVYESQINILEGMSAAILSAAAAPNTWYSRLRRRNHLRGRFARAAEASFSQDNMPPLFDAGVPLEKLPWGSEGSRAVASRTFTYNDGNVALEAYMAWDAEAAAGRPSGGLSGVLVAHTAIGPQEVFIHSCCDALARMGYAALALDLFGTKECIFDKQTRDRILGPLREDRAKYAARVQASYEALCAQPEVDESAGVVGIGFCLGGQAVLDLARAKTASGLRGVVSFHGSLDNPSTLPSPQSSSSSTASVLILHGDDDPFNPPEKLQECARGLKAAGIEYEVHVYGGAKHAFTRPEKTKPEDVESGFGYHPHAAARSWAAARTFMAEVLDGGA